MYQLLAEESGIRVIEEAFYRAKRAPLEELRKGIENESDCIYSYGLKLRIAYFPRQLHRSLCRNATKRNGMGFFSACPVAEGYRAMSVLLGDAGYILSHLYHAHVADFARFLLALTNVRLSVLIQARTRTSQDRMSWTPIELLR